jgi:hypothetical protein
VFVLLAFGRAGIAGPGTELEHFLENRFVGSGPPDGELAGRFTDVGAIEAGTNALAHVHLPGRAGIGAAEAHSRAIHQMVGRVGERLVQMALNVRVQSNHLADRHSLLLLSITEPVDSNAVPLEPAHPQA